MIISNFGSNYRIENPSDIARIMSKRFDEGQSEVVLMHDDREHPFIIIALKDDLAVLHYFTDDESAGFSSIGGKLGLPPDGKTTFKAGGPHTDIEVRNDAIVTSSEALAAAKEFFHSKQLPKSIKWREL
jgi:Immunity protein Imm1